MEKLRCEHCSLVHPVYTMCPLNKTHVHCLNRFFLKETCYLRYSAHCDVNQCDVYSCPSVLGVDNSKSNEIQDVAIGQKSLLPKNDGYRNETHHETQVDGTKLVLGAALGVTITIAIVFLGVYIKHTLSQR